MAKIDQKLGAAKALIADGQFEKAVTIISDTAHDFLDDYDQLRLALDDAILQLSNQSSRSDPPHPRTVSLIRLRRKLPS